MERRHLLVRRAVSAVAALVALSSFAACGSGPVGKSAAATVDGHDIGVNQVTKLLDAQKRYLVSQGKDAKNDPQKVQAALRTFLGTGKDTYSSAPAAEAVGSWITYEVIRADLARHGEKVTATDRSGARAQLVKQVGSEAALKKVDKDLLAFSVNSAAAYTAIGRVAAKQGTSREKKLRDLYAATKATTPLCLRIIFSETAAASNAAKARVDAGEDFAAVAKDVSADPTTAAQDGFAGCATADQAKQAFGEDFTSVAVGDIVGPLPQTSGGVLLVQVDSTTGPTFEQARAKLEQQLDSAQGGNEASAYVGRLLAKAKVHVDPRYGTWDAATGQVVPPAVDAPTTTTSAVAPVAGS